MYKVCVLLANGFEEIEATTIIDVLRRADVEVSTLGVEGERIRGAHAIEVVADNTLAAGAKMPWDMVILPGGLPGALTLRDDAAVQALITRQHEAGGCLAAICAGPIALGKAGVLTGKRATCYPGFGDGLRGAEVVDARVVQDGDVITSQGPGTAMEFALHLVTELAGADASSEVRQAMLV